MKATTQHGFIVLQELCNGQQQPVFREDDLLMFFPTIKEAEAEVLDAIQCIDEAIERKHMDKDAKITAEDYTIVSATLEGDAITVEMENGTYQMQRIEEDWHQIA